MNLSYHIETRGYHNGQYDLTLKCYTKNQLVGYIDYADFQGEPHVQMIKVHNDFRRQGIGREMLIKLQKSYPDIQIEMGTLTDDGERLITSMSQKKIYNKDVLEKMKKLKDVKEKIEKYHQIMVDVDDHKGTPEHESKLDNALKVTSDWQDLYDMEWELENYLRDTTPYIKVFESISW